MKTLVPRILAVLGAVALLAPATLSSQTVLLEAESFSDSGGWVLDTQFIDAMGSPYLLAHGLGKPVKDAVTRVDFPETGKYRVFVRTKDWVAQWKATGAPGKFQVLVEGQPLKEIFGTEGAQWHWQPGGEVDIKARQVSVALHDLTGFEGRCDAIVFTRDANYSPPNDAASQAAWRRQLLGLPDKPIEAGSYDLVVVGGGYGGLGAAVSAARMGCKVALIQNRPVLGGNGSSEVRVWAKGGTRRGLYPKLGEIVDELADQAKMSPGTAEEFEDAKKEAIVRAEKNITLFLNHHVSSVEMNGSKIAAVLAFDTRTGAVRRFAGRLFADCTGHASVGAMAGADNTLRESEHLGMSNMWRHKNEDKPAEFPNITWALDLTMDDFPYPTRGHGPWFWESGFNKHPISELESTRDWNFRAVYGAFNAMKNKEGKAEHLNASLEWMAYIGGPRESRQLLGDVVLNREDIEKKKPFPDGCVPTTWDIDLHYPKEQYAKKFPDDPFISKAIFDKAVDREHGYPVPYRCLYSRNIANLFMAGRNVSVTHEALGTVRVMKTGGMMGEVVGKAASLCIRHSANPREIYPKYFDELKELMNLPGAARRENVQAKIVLPAAPPPMVPADPIRKSGLDPAAMPGIVVDDEKAKLTGNWTKGHGLAGYIGSGYQYASPKGKATARFEFQVAAGGRHEVRAAHQPHENRSSKTTMTVFSASGPTKVLVNQQKKTDLPPTFVSLGKFQFEAGKTYAVEVETEGADGNVHIDAIQVVPVK